MIRTPKVYFYDTGLLCYLLGITDAEHLRYSPFREAVLENLIVVETMKRHLNAGETPHLFFYRDGNGVEVDLMDSTNPSKMELIGVKASRTFQQNYLRHVTSVGEALNVSPDRRFVVMRSPETTTLKQAKIWTVRDWLLR